MKSFHRLLNNTYRDGVRNEEVERRIRQSIGPYDSLLNTEKEESSNGMVMLLVHQALQRQSYKEL